MEVRPRNVRLGVGAMIALVIFILFVNRMEDLITNIEYPLNIWRMDLDDLLANLGLFFGGFAAFLMVFKKAKAAEVKAEAVSDRINGGMARMAREHIEMATNEAQEADHYVNLLSRVTDLETQRNDCMEELGQIKTWIENRLDDSGQGRGNAR